MLSKRSTLGLRGYTPKLDCTKLPSLILKLNFVAQEGLEIVISLGLNAYATGPSFLLSFFFSLNGLCVSTGALLYFVLRQVLLAETSLKLAISLPQPPRYWDYRCGPPHPVPNYAFLISLSRSEGSLRKEIVLICLSGSSTSKFCVSWTLLLVPSTPSTPLKYTATSVCFPFCPHRSKVGVRFQETSST